MADPTDRTSIDDLTDAVAEWWRFNTFGARFESEMHPSFASSARQILDCIQAFLRERGLLLSPDGLLRAEPGGLTALERSTVWIVQEQHALDGYVDDVLAVFSTEERARSFAADQPAEAGVDLHVFSAQLDPAYALSPLDPPEDT